MDNKKSYVYKITCLVTGEFYFGSSFNAKRDNYWGKGRKIKERIAKYGKENFFKEILEEFDDRVDAHKVENDYIEKFRHDDKCLNQMLNRHFGTYSYETRAKGSVAKCGKHLSEEAKTKIGDAQRGKIVSEETRAKLSDVNRGEKNPMYGKHLSEEAKTKIGDAQRGKHLSEEMRAKLSAVHRGKHWRKNPVTGKREWYD